MRLLLKITLLTCGVLAGCNTHQTPIARDALVGSYVYKSEDPENKATDHSLDHLVLQSDGKYDLVQGGSTKPRTEIFGAWTVWNGGSDGPRVLLDHSGYPVQVKNTEVRLLIDNDTGIWFAKTK